ncbi:MAG TPA: flavodoxin domain-containing protein [Thermoanaerobaculia bacterium]|nr:flavodoxin domain-containing protein [Thermoanaerobaculia bacterium]
MATKIAIVYSSKHGHVRAIAERLAGIAAVRHIECSVTDVRLAGDALATCDAAIVAGSVHFGRHARPLRRFVERKLEWLSAIPSAFLSVSGSAASLEGIDKANQYIDDFVRGTGWQPDMTLSAAGAVLYTKYDPLTRLMMKFASRTAGRETDTSRDVVYTNWIVVDEFMHQFIDTLERHARAAAEKRARA